MNKIKDFYNSFGFIIVFMFMSVLISALFGEKFLNKFLILVLTSQLVFNSDKAIDLLNKIKTNNEKVNTNSNGNIQNKFSGDVNNGKLNNSV